KWKGKSEKWEVKSEKGLVATFFTSPFLLLTSCGALFPVLLADGPGSGGGLLDLAPVVGGDAAVDAEEPPGPEPERGEPEDDERHAAHVGGGVVEEVEEGDAAGHQRQRGADVGEEGPLVGEVGPLGGEVVAEDEVAERDGVPVRAAGPAERGHGEE